MLALVNTALSLFVIPSLVLTGLLLLSRYSPAGSPAWCFWKLCILGGATLVFIPLSLFLPDITLPVLHSPLSQFTHAQAWYAHTGGLIWVVVYSVVASGLVWRHAQRWWDARDLVSTARPLAVQAHPAFKALPSHVVVRCSDSLSSPVVWGWRRPVIVLPSVWRDWPHARLERVIAHEYAHIQRGDWCLKNVLYLVRAAFWFLPPLWFMVRRAALYAEFACDDRVIRSGASRAEYADDLLALSARESCGAGFSSVGGTAMIERLGLILEGGREREDVGLSYKLFVLVSFFAVTAPMFSLSLAEKPLASRFAQLDLVPLALELQQSESSRQDESETPLPVSIPTLPQPRPVEAVLVRAPLSAPAPVTELDSASALALSNVWQPEAKKHSVLSQPSVSVSGTLPELFHSPDYPRAALMRGIEASLTVQFDLNEHGLAENILVFAHPHRALFASSIEEALQKSRFRPRQLNGMPVRVTGLKEHVVFRIVDP